MHAHPEQPSRPHFLHTAGRGGRTSNNGGGRWRDGESLELSSVDESSSSSSSSSRREARRRGGSDGADFRPGRAMDFLCAWLATGACFFLSASASCFLRTWGVRSNSNEGNEEGAPVVPFDAVHGASLLALLCCLSANRPVRRPADITYKRIQTMRRTDPDIFQRPPRPSRGIFSL
jgi:hypothetical protein